MKGRNLISRKIHTDLAYFRIALLMLGLNKYFPMERITITLMPIFTVQSVLLSVVNILRERTFTGEWKIYFY